MDNRVMILGDVHGGFKSLLQVFERCNLDYENDEVICLGDVVDGWPESKQCVDELLKIKNLIYIIGNHDCLSGDTQALTNEGWKNYNEIKKSHLVYSYNTEAEHGQWVPVKDIIIKDFDGELNFIETNHLSLMCTDNHRVLHSKRQTDNRKKKFFSKFSYNEFKNLSGRIMIPLSKDQKAKGLDLSNDEIKFIAWILTDGGCIKGNSIYHTNQYRIYQSKRNNIPYITKLLHRLKYKFNLSKRNRETSEILGKKIKSCMTSYEFRLLNKANKKIEKILPYKYPFYNKLFNMSNEQFSIFLPELIKGDGSNYNHTDTAWILYGDKEFLDNIQILCILNNIRASLTQDTRGAYRLNISDYNTTQLDIIPLNNKIKYKGKIWCLSVPNTNFMVRRNGKHFFTGNCWAYNFAKDNEREIMWISQGGWNTLKSYDFKPMPPEHMALFKNANLWVEDEEKNIIFCHGGFNPAIAIEKQKGSDIMWDRDLIKLAKRKETQARCRAHDTGKDYMRPKNITKYSEVFIGHTTTFMVDGGDKPVHMCEIWNLDTGGGWEGKLTIMDLETKEYWQSDKVSDLYPGSEGRGDFSQHDPEVQKWLYGTVYTDPLLK